MTDTSAVIAYFRAHDKALKHVPGNVVRMTRFGPYAPTPLEPLETCMRQLISERSIPESGVMSDAGYGDGRIIAFMNSLGYDTGSFEGDRVLAQKGRGNVQVLMSGEHWRTDRHAILAQGNFLDARLYEECLGIPFEQVPLFFNYQSNGEALAGLIRDNSPAGTKLLYLSHEQWKYEFTSAGEMLVHKRTLKLDLHEGRDMFLRLYEKVNPQKNRSRISRHAHAPREIRHHAFTAHESPQYHHL